MPHEVAVIGTGTDPDDPAGDGDATVPRHGPADEAVHSEKPRDDTDSGARLLTREGA